MAQVVNIGKIQGELELKDKKFGKAADRSKTKLVGLKKEATKTGGAAGGQLAGGMAVATKAIIGTTAVIIVGIAALKAFTGAANEQEDAVNKLTNALTPLGNQASATSVRLQEQAASLQAVTTAGDEVIISGQATIAFFNRNEEVIKSATIAALDLSAATGTNLRSAFLLMGRAAAGETSTLSRYGIILDKGIPQSEKFAAAVAKIEEQFGGAAAAGVTTFSGGLTQISNLFGDIVENAGFVITQSDFAQAAINKVRLAFLRLVIETGGSLKTTEQRIKDRIALTQGNLDAINSEIARLEGQLSGPRSTRETGFAIGPIQITEQRTIEEVNTGSGNVPVKILEDELTIQRELLANEVQVGEALAKNLELLERTIDPSEKIKTATAEQVKAEKERATALEEFNTIAAEIKTEVELTLGKTTELEVRQTAVTEQLRLAGEAAGLTTEQMNLQVEASTRLLEDQDKYRVAQAERVVQEDLITAAIAEQEETFQRQRDTAVDFAQNILKDIATGQASIKSIGQDLLALAIDIATKKLAELAIDALIRLAGLGIVDGEKARLEVMKDQTDELKKQEILALIIAALGSGGGSGGGGTGSVGTGTQGVPTGVPGASVSGVAASGGVAERAQIRLVGEAGPEALIPLTDRVLGKIGGGGKRGNVIINNNSSAQVEEPQFDGPDAEDVVISIVERNVGRGGRVARALEGRFEVNRRGTRR